MAAGDVWSSTASRRPAPWPRQFAAFLCIVLASIVAFAAIFAIWVRHQALDGGTWADTSTRIIKDEKVRITLSAYLADQLTNNADARAALQPLVVANADAANATTAAVHRGIETAADRILQTPEAQSAWRAASLEAQRQFIRALDGEDGSVSVHGDEVVLDLRALVRTLAEKVGLDPAQADQIPAQDSRIVVLQSHDVQTARTSLTAVRDLSIVLPVLTLLLWGLALWLARGHRWTTLAGIATGLVVAAAAALVTRAIAGDRILDALVREPTDRPAADRVWSIATSVLRDTAIWLLLAGIAVALVALVVGAVSRRSADRGYDY
jgi:hypothetical protein